MRPHRTRSAPARLVPAFNYLSTADLLVWASSVVDGVTAAAVSLVARATTAATTVRRGGNIAGDGCGADLFVAPPSIIVAVAAYGLPLLIGAGATTADTATAATAAAAIAAAVH